MDDDWKARLKTEDDDLADKATELSAFIQSPAYTAIPEADKTDLEAQLETMNTYRMLLQRRMSRMGA